MVDYLKKMFSFGAVFLHVALQAVSSNGRVATLLASEKASLQCARPGVVSAASCAAGVATLLAREGFFSTVRKHVCL